MPLYILNMLWKLQSKLNYEINIQKHRQGALTFAESLSRVKPELPPPTGLNLNLNVRRQTATSDIP